MNPFKTSKIIFSAYLLIFLGAAATHVHGQKLGISFLHDDWAVTCDNTLTCRMEGYSAEGGDSSGGVLITRSAGPNARLHGAVTLGGYDDTTSDPCPPVLKLMVDGEEKARLKYPGKDSSTYPLTQAQVLVLLAAAKNDKMIEFEGGDESFVLSGKGISAVMLKMDDIQGRVGTPGALIRKGKKPETSVRAPVPMPVIRAAKTIDKPVSRELTASEAQAIEPMLWKTKGEVCSLHEPEQENGREAESFTLTPVDERHALISTPCMMAMYQGTVAYWLTDKRGKKVIKFLLEDVDAYYVGESGIIASSGRGRGLGDCLGGSDWVWNGTDFLRSSEWSTGRCRGQLGGTWHGENSILTYVAKVIPPK
ncbi:MAG: DUF1176 domain-containing protein [Azoarcus sp.]|jgi:hypothetical protein|nr:DUF1176 domain-containing protein [Azoarcus sp.]